VKRFFVPGFALALGLAAFLWLQLRVLPQIAHSQTSDPREEHLIAELNAVKIAGAKGPALADIIKSNGLLLRASYEMQIALAKLSRVLSLMLFATGSIDLYTIVRLRQKARLAEPA